MDFGTIIYDSRNYQVLIDKPTCPLGFMFPSTIVEIIKSL